MALNRNIDAIGKGVYSRTQSGALPAGPTPDNFEPSRLQTDGVLLYTELMDAGSECWTLVAHNMAWFLKNKCNLPKASAEALLDLINLGSVVPHETVADLQNFSYAYPQVSVSNTVPQWSKTLAEFVGTVLLGLQVWRGQQIAAAECAKALTDRLFACIERLKTEVKKSGLSDELEVLLKIDAATRALVQCERDLANDKESAPKAFRSNHTGWTRRAASVCLGLCVAGVTASAAAGVGACVGPDWKADWTLAARHWWHLSPYVFRVCGPQTPQQAVDGPVRWEAVSDSDVGGGAGAAYVADATDSDGSQGASDASGGGQDLHVRDSAPHMRLTDDRPQTPERIRFDDPRIENIRQIAQGLHPRWRSDWEFARSATADDVIDLLGFSGVPDAAPRARLLIRAIQLLIPVDRQADNPFYYGPLYKGMFSVASDMMQKIKDHSWETNNALPAGPAVAMRNP